MGMHLGPRATQLFAYCHMRGLETVKTGDLTSPLKITRKQERELLSRMARAGIIARVRRGLYLIPSRLPLGGIWSPSLSLAINTLMEDRGATYQICGPNAFNHWGFDEQIPNRVYAYNDHISGDRKIGTVELTLIKTTNNRLGNMERVQTSSGADVMFSSRTRTLFDAVYDSSRFDSLPRGYSWIRTELKAKRISATELATITVIYGNQGTIRRIGAFLQKEHVREDVLSILEAALRPSMSTIAAVPNRPRKGSLSKRWGVIFNEQ